MQREASTLPVRLSLTRWAAYGSALVLAMVALMPLHHRLWPLSLFILATGPLAERWGRRDPRRGKRVSTEEPITSRLAELEESGYRILRQVDTGRNRIDQVIVGPAGIFVVRVNTWPGRFSLRRDGWFQHTRGDAGELVWEVAQEVMAMRARLNSQGLAGRVQGLVAVTRSTMAEPVIHMGRVTFVQSDMIINYLTSRRPLLSDDEVSQVAAGIPA